MAERGYLVLSALGPDRPGLVRTLSASIVAHGGNVEDSRMAVLGGLFGVMMLLSGDRAALAAMEGEAANLEAATGLRIHCEPTAPPPTTIGTRRYIIEAEAVDREGIVHAVAEAFHALGANIVHLESALYPAPISGAPLFRIRLEIDVPLSACDRLAHKVAELEQHIDLECHVREA
jgi:glycine cleavage system transcriptional repressor